MAKFTILASFLALQGMAAVAVAAGCYSTADLERIAAVHVNTPLDTNRLRLLLTTRANPATPDLLNMTTPLYASHFNAAKNVKILIPGYLDSVEACGWTEMATAFLQAEDSNVMRLDWAAGNLAPYPQALGNAQAVGSFMARVIQFFITSYGVNPQNIHIVGHSLGGQMAGFIGKAAKRAGVTIGRITGLDPAGSSDQAAANRLDSTDAKFVDTIISSQGQSYARGHINFFPNGGLQQPGCPTLFSAISLGDRICNHVRARNFFTDSITFKGCTMTGVQCDSYERFAQGACSGQRSTPLGYGANGNVANGAAGLKFFLKTGAASPYCRV